MRVITVQIFCSDENVEVIKQGIEDMLNEAAQTDTPFATDPHISWNISDKDEVLE